MSMRLWGVPYRVRNRVVEFEENRLIAWRHFEPQHWRFELQPTKSGTRVTETFDYSYWHRAGAELRAVIAWRWPTTYVWAPDYGGFDFAADARKTLEEAVTEALGSPPSVPVTISVTEGHPAAVLFDASRSADLLVVGSQGHGAFTGILLGSVSQHCVQHATCPVLVYRRPGPLDTATDTAQLGKVVAQPVLHVRPERVTLCFPATTRGQCTVSGPPVAPCIAGATDFDGVRRVTWLGRWRQRPAGQASSDGADRGSW